MENLYLKDGMGIKIEEGTGISRIITYVDSYPALGELAAELTRDNLSDMQIGAEGAAGTGAYRDMALTEPHFRITDQGERLKVVFGLRQLTEEELKAPSVAAAAAYLTDEQALTVKDLYPAWESLIGKTVKPGARFTYADALYKVITQEPLLIQEQWIPGEGTSAIYSQIIEGQIGTFENPIDVPEDVATNAFTYIIGKYYRWKGIIYKCQNDNDPEGTEYSFTYSPDQLLEQYFTIA